MTDVSTTAPITVRRLSLPRLSIPTFRVGASFAAMSVLLGDAFGMAYVDPYTRRQPQLVPDDDLKGRDPNW